MCLVGSLRAIIVEVRRLVDSQTCGPVGSWVKGVRDQAAAGGLAARRLLETGLEAGLFEGW